MTDNEIFNKTKDFLRRAKLEPAFQLQMEVFVCKELGHVEVPIMGKHCLEYLHLPLAVLNGERDSQSFYNNLRQTSPSLWID